MTLAKVRDENGGRCPWGGRKTGTRVRVTAEKEAAVLAMFREGRRVAAIAHPVELTRKTVYSVLERHAIKTDRLSRAAAKPLKVPRRRVRTPIA